MTDENYMAMRAPRPRPGRTGPTPPPQPRRSPQRPGDGEDPRHPDKKTRPSPPSVPDVPLPKGPGGDRGPAPTQRPSAPPGSNSPGGSISACAFRLDVQWILDAIQRVQDTVKKVADVMVKVAQKIQQVLEALSGILDLFCFIGPLKYAKSVVENACKLAERVIPVVATIYDKILEVTKHFLAPWEVRSAGEQIRDDLAPKCADFALMLHDGHFKSKSSWTGDVADLFRAGMKRQQDTANQAAEQAKTFGEKVYQVGSEGVTTTVTFITELVTALVGLITAAIEMAAVPVGTAIGAAQILGLVSAIISFIMVFVNAMMQIASQISELNQAATSVNGGEWPKATFA